MHEWRIVYPSNTTPSEAYEETALQRAVVARVKQGSETIPQGPFQAPAPPLLYHVTSHAFVHSKNSVHSSNPSPCGWSTCQSRPCSILLFFVTYRRSHTHTHRRHQLVQRVQWAGGAGERSSPWKHQQTPQTPVSSFIF